ncbi:hypothetical protein NDN08_000212 [Rhodosorus marinus]|uniref:CBM20 domain-containing protein n=1 Tax=Rhodosorus marinus TaxID=101924 RepID=A0AAV8UHA0_9RHOD|nr:hypothetical protein NDN08_000212 [Rhodosorus marinus]
MAGFMVSGWNGFCRERSRRLLVCNASGSIKQIPDGDVAVGDTVTISYRPPAGFFKEGHDLHFAGGYNGWDGDDVPVMTPAQMDTDGAYRMVVTIPNFAQVVDFAISDGIRYDTNDGSFFHIPIRFQQRLGDDGEVEVYDSADEKQRKVEIKEFRDANSTNVVAITPENEKLLHEARATADMVSERFSLGSIHISQATAAYDRIDKTGVGKVAIDAAILAFEEMGFETDKSTLSDMLNDYAEGKERTLFEELTASDFIVAYALLESDESALEIV